MKKYGVPIIDKGWTVPLMGCRHWWWKSIALMPSSQILPKSGSDGPGQVVNTCTILPAVSLLIRWTGWIWFLFLLNDGKWIEPSSRPTSQATHGTIWQLSGCRNASWSIGATKAENWVHMPSHLLFEVASHSNWQILIWSSGFSGELSHISNIGERSTDQGLHHFLKKGKFSCFYLKLFDLIGRLHFSKTWNIRSSDCLLEKICLIWRKFFCQNRTVLVVRTPG